MDNGIDIASSYIELLEKENRILADCVIHLLFPEEKVSADIIEKIKRIHAETKERNKNKEGNHIT